MNLGLNFCLRCGATHAGAHTCRILPATDVNRVWVAAPTSQATGPYTWAALGKRAREMADATRGAQ